MAKFVLVHGGMSGGWCWKMVRKRLEEQGHQVLTPTLTGLGEKRHLINKDVDLSLHIQDVLNAIFYEDLHEIILVGHSYGGMVIAGVADKIPEEVDQLIFLDALIPKNGDSVCSLMGPRVTTYFKRVANERGEGWKVPAASVEAFGIADKTLSDWFMARVSPNPLKCFSQPISLTHDVIHHFKSTYIICANDPTMESMHHLSKQHKMSIKSMQSDHFPMVTQPENLTNLLLAIIQEESYKEKFVEHQLASV